MVSRSVIDVVRNSFRHDELRWDQSVVRNGSCRQLSLALAGEYGVTVKVTTNGWKIPDELLAAIEAGTVVHVNLSLDGADEVTHDVFRGRQGSFARVLR